MGKRTQCFISAIALLALGGCVTMPSGPSVMVLPEPGKSFEQFQAEDALCRQWAAQRLGLSPENVANQNAATGAVVGTLVGAGLGAAIGAAAGDPALGAAIGAGSGLFMGTASGANAGQVYGWEAQHQYDISYLQCMYAKGNQIPGTTRRTYRTRRMPPPPPPDWVPPPESYYTTPPPAN
jgi:outer membrane lipoprotein SlyB